MSLAGWARLGADEICPHSVRAAWARSMARGTQSSGSRSQRIDPARGRGVGKPSVVRHFHDLNGVGAVSTSLGNAVTSQGFVDETLSVRSSPWKLVPSGRLLDLDGEPDEPPVHALVGCTCARNAPGSAASETCR